ncbi:unnamed protein product, partial [marine sediment metagenome]
MNKSSKRRIKTLEPKTKELALLFLPLADKWLKENGWEGNTFEITEGKRDIYKQAGLYSLGRKYVNWEGWQVADPLSVVTWTMKSNHLTGHAFDCAMYLDKLYSWPNPKIEKNLLMWLSLAEIGQELGLYPGG